MSIFLLYFYNMTLCGDNIYCWKMGMLFLTTIPKHSLPPPYCLTYKWRNRPSTVEVTNKCTLSSVSDPSHSRSQTWSNGVYLYAPPLWAHGHHPPPSHSQNTINTSFSLWVSETVANRLLVIRNKKYHQLLKTIICKQEILIIIRKLVNLWILRPFRNTILERNFHRNREMFWWPSRQNTPSKEPRSWNVYRP